MEEPGTTPASSNSLQTKILGHVAPPPDPTDDTLVSNLGQNTVSEGATAGPLAGNHYETAMPFTTGTYALGYHITSTQLYLSKLLGSGTPTPQVSIRADNEGVPGETVAVPTTFTTSTAITG